MCTPAHTTKANGILAVSLSFQIENVRAAATGRKSRARERSGKDLVDLLISICESYAGENRSSS
jgi:hypothetical protein